MEESPTRSKPLIVLTLLVLSMAATALAQVEGGENGTDQVEIAASATTKWLERNETIIGAIVGIFAIIGYLSGFFSRIKKIILTILGKKPPEKSSPNQQISTENRTTAASGEGSVAIGGDVSGSTIIVTHKDPESLKKSYHPPEPPQLDELPPRGDLPPGSHVPFSPNRVFTGREEDLLKLARSLFRSDSKGVTITQTAAVATGLGGVGKTQLAIEFCYLYGRFFHGVHWIQADHDIAAEVAACGKEMGISPWPNELEERTNITLQAWKEAGPRLVIFDNVEDPTSVQDWQPRLPKARFLITSRSSDWPPYLDIEHHPLGVLPRSESLELLRKLAGRLESVPDEELEKVADRLGDLPLALDLAGNYLRSRPTLSPAEYLAELDEVGRSLLEHPAFSDWVKHNPTNHSTSLVYTFALSWNQLTDGATDKLAGRIFRACGYCAPNTPIPWELLAKTASAEDTSQLQNLDQALNRLYGLGLIMASEGGSIVIHPLLAEFARIQDQDADVSALHGLAKALAGLASWANKTGLPKEMEPLNEHLWIVAKAAENSELEIACNLFHELGYHFASIADYDGAKEHYEQALKIGEKGYGPDDPIVATIMNSIGTILRQMGNLASAKELLEQAIEIGEKAHGSEHPQVAIYVNNLGNVLLDMGNLASAKDCFERALKISENTLGPEHPDVAIRVNNLGTVLLKMGDLEGAKKSYERALKIDENTLGPEHPNVAIRVNNLGHVLLDMDKLASAKDCFERALKISENTLGPKHPNVATISNNLGSVLQALGELEGAKKSFEQALEIDVKVYGPEHSSVARDVNNLGGVLQALGDLAGAKKSFEQALEIDVKVYGPDHPDVATIHSNLGFVLEAMGDLDSGKEHYVRALEIFRSCLGEDHPNTEIMQKILESLRR